MPYIYDEGGVFLTITLPGGASGQATGINNLQQVCGFYFDKKGVSHGFLLNAGSLTTLSFPESAGTMALGLNTKGQVVGSYTDNAGGTHGFIWSSKTKFESLDDPNGIGETIINGINDSGELAGFWTPTSTTANGFIANPRGQTLFSSPSTRQWGIRRTCRIPRTVISPCCRDSHRVRSQFRAAAVVDQHWYLPGLAGRECRCRRRVALALTQNLESLRLEPPSRRAGARRKDSVRQTPITESIGHLQRDFYQEI